MRIGNQAALEAALAVIGKPETIEDNEFTVYEYAEKAGIPKKTADTKLRECARLGKMSCRKVLVEGRWVNAYSLIPPVVKPRKR